MQKKKKIQIQPHISQYCWEIKVLHKNDISLNFQRHNDHILLLLHYFNKIQPNDLTFLPPAPLYEAPGQLTHSQKLNLQVHVASIVLHPC